MCWNCLWLLQKTRELIHCRSELYAGSNRIGATLRTRMVWWDNRVCVRHKWQCCLCICILSDWRDDWTGTGMWWGDTKNTRWGVLRRTSPWKGRRGRPKTRWKDACRQDLKSTGLRAGEETDRAMWRRKIRGQDYKEKHKLDSKQISNSLC